MFNGNSSGWHEKVIKFPMENWLRKFLKTKNANNYSQSLSSTSEIFADKRHAQYKHILQFEIESGAVVFAVEKWQIKSGVGTYRCMCTTNNFPRLIHCLCELQCRRWYLRMWMCVWTVLCVVRLWNVEMSLDFVFFSLSFGMAEWIYGYQSVQPIEHGSHNVQTQFTLPQISVFFFIRILAFYWAENDRKSQTRHVNEESGRR